MQTCSIAHINAARRRQISITPTVHEIFMQRLNDIFGEIYGKTQQKKSQCHSSLFSFANNSLLINLFYSFTSSLFKQSFCSPMYFYHFIFAFFVVFVVSLSLIWLFAIHIFAASSSLPSVFLYVNYWSLQKCFDVPRDSLRSEKGQLRMRRNRRRRRE